MIPTFLVFGSSAEARETLIASKIAASASLRTAVLIEGLATGQPVFSPGPDLLIARIAAGCLCCSNNMIMRVHLNRLIQQQPQQLFLSLATDSHLDKITQFLSSSGYDKHIKLTGKLYLPT